MGANFLLWGFLCFLSLVCLAYCFGLFLNVFTKGGDCTGNHIPDVSYLCEQSIKRFL